MKIFSGANVTFNKEGGVGGVIHKTNSLLAKKDFKFTRFFRQNSFFKKGMLAYITYPFIASRKALMEKPDIVHFHCGHSSYVYSLLKNSPMILTSHGSDVGALKEFNKEIILGHIPLNFLAIKEMLYLKLNKLQEFISTKNADRIVAVSNHAAKDIIGVYNLPKDKVSVIYNGVNYNLFSPNAGKIKMLQKLKGPKILFIGGWNWIKGNYYLAKAFPKVLEKIPNAKLVIITGRESEEIVKKSFPKKVQSSISVYSCIKNSLLPKYYNSCSLFVLPSLYEGHSLSVLEAMACEIPIIGTNVADMRLTIEKSKSGIVVPPRDIDALANSIIYLINHPKESKAMGKRGRKKVIKQFSWSKSADKLYDLYRSIISNKGNKSRTGRFGSLMHFFSEQKLRGLNHIPPIKSFKQNPCLKIDKPIFFFTMDDICEDTDMKSLSNLSKVLSSNSVKSTFFIIPFCNCKISQSKANGIKKILKGHELAQHGVWHNEKEAKLGCKEHLKYVAKGKRFLENLFKTPFLGYRSPKFLRYRNLFSGLSKIGFSYDSDQFLFRPHPFVKDNLVVIPCHDKCDPFSMGLDDKSILSLVKSKIEYSIKSGKPYVFLMHAYDINEKNLLIMGKIFKKLKSRGFAADLSLSDFANSLDGSLK